MTEPKVFTVELLRLNEPSINGRVYTREAVEAAVAEFKTRSDKGVAMVQYGSPRADDRTSLEQAYLKYVVQNVQPLGYAGAFATVDETRVCGNLSNLKWDGDSLLADFKPMGVFADQALPLVEEQSVGFGMRSYLQAGTDYTKPEVLRIITFDLVSNPVWEPKGGKDELPQS